MAVNFVLHSCTCTQNRIEIFTTHIRDTQSINEFKNDIKIGMALVVHGDYVGYLCYIWGSCDWIFFAVWIATSDIHY